MNLTVKFQQKKPTQMSNYNIISSYEAQEYTVWIYGKIELCL